MDFLDVAWDLVKGDLLIAWLLAAVFWAVAGVAAASWARMNPVAGGLIGAVTLFLGCLGILLYGAARKAGSAAPAGQPDFGPFHAPHSTPVGWTKGNGTVPVDADPWLGASGSGATGFGDPADGGAWGDTWFGATGPTPVADPGPSAPSASGVFRAVVLSCAAVVTAVYLAAIFSPWLSLGIGLEIDGADVALVPLSCTVLAVGACAALCWRGPRRLPAVVIAWFSSWWLLLGVLALSEGGYVAETITALAARTIADLQLDQHYAESASVTLGIGVSLVALGGITGLAWAIVAVLRRAAGVTWWSG